MALWRGLLSGAACENIGLACKVQIPQVQGNLICLAKNEVPQAGSVETAAGAWLQLIDVGSAYVRELSG